MLCRSECVVYASVPFEHFVKFIILHFVVYLYFISFMSFSSAAFSTCWFWCCCL